MLFSDTYRTIDNAGEALFRDKGSKFLAFAYPVTNMEAVKPILTELKTLHPKANHHCWAVRLTPDRGVFRVNDDGEPSGTAGRPILNAMLSADVTNMLIVVVRYFGGTLLGVAGLINAYKTASLEVLSGLTIVEKTVNDIYEVEFSHELMNPVMRIIKEEGIAIIAHNYTENNVLQISVRKNAVNSVTAQLDKIHGIKIKFLYSN